MTIQCTAFNALSIDPFPLSQS